MIANKIRQCLVPSGEFFIKNFIFSILQTADILQSLTLLKRPVRFSLLQL
jgi:hypothetical protein